MEESHESNLLQVNKASIIILLLFHNCYCKHVAAFG